jgi:hypothetical protein
MPSQLFASASEIRAESGIAAAPMGTRVDSIGRYKMPPLDGDKVPKSVQAGMEPWVSGGIQSMTNLAASISDTKALGQWDREQVQIGTVLHPELTQELRTAVYAAKERGTDFTRVKDDPELRAQLGMLAERAKDISGANAARDAGIVRHDHWQERGESGGHVFSGTEQINGEMRALRQLLDAAGFEIIPDLVERTVRNLAVQAAGRFDNILMHRRTGRLLMADLKTKRGAVDGGDPFWGWLEMDAQLAGYAYSEWMLRWRDDGEVTYVPGPREHVDLTEGVVLHMPSDGGEPRLRRADLVDGWRALQLAREVCTVRSRGKSAGRKAESWWPVS